MRKLVQLAGGIVIAGVVAVIVIGILCGGNFKTLKFIGKNSEDFMKTDTDYSSYKDDKAVSNVISHALNITTKEEGPIEVSSSDDIRDAIYIMDSDDSYTQSLTNAIKDKRIEKATMTITGLDNSYTATVSDLSASVNLPDAGSYQLVVEVKDKYSHMATLDTIVFNEEKWEDGK